MAMSLRRRLDALCGAVEVQQSGAIASLSEWIMREGDDEEREAWKRKMLNVWIPDALLAPTGWSREAAEEYIAREIGPVRIGDDAIIRAMLSRVPADIRRRISEAFGDNLVEAFNL